jgi:hypothetical protein
VDVGVVSCWRLDGALFRRLPRYSSWLSLGVARALRGPRPLGLLRSTGSVSRTHQHHRTAGHTVLDHAVSRRITVAPMLAFFAVTCSTDCLGSGDHVSNLAVGVRNPRFGKLPRVSCGKPAILQLSMLGQIIEPYLTR